MELHVGALRPGATARASCSAPGPAEHSLAHIVTDPDVFADADDTSDPAAGHRDADSDRDFCADRVSHASADAGNGHADAISVRDRAALVRSPALGALYGSLPARVHLFPALF